MSDMIKVSYSDLEQTAAHIGSAREGMFTELARVKGLIDSLVTSGFVTGSASQAFHSAYNKYNAGATKMVEGLDGVQKYLKLVENTLRDTDGQLAAQISQ